MSQIGSLDITKSKTFQGLLSYVQQLGHILRQLDQDKANLLKTGIKKILKLNHTSLTTIFTQANTKYKAKSLVKFSVMEHF